MKCPAVKLVLVGLGLTAAVLVLTWFYAGVRAESKTAAPADESVKNARRAYLGLLTTIAPQLPPPEQSPKELLAPYFGDHMIFQRNQPLRLWGKALPSEMLRISAQGQGFSVIGCCHANNNGDWFLTLPLDNAVGAFQIKISAGQHKSERSAHLNDVLFGDVFLCAGQSNMMMNLRSAKDCSVQMFKPGTPVRIVNMGEGKPCTRKWTSVDGGVANLAEYSALATVFADDLADKSGVPVGIIQVCVGGTSILHWLDPAKIPAAISARIDKSAILPIYRCCIAPIERCAYKAVVWYQGESDLEQPFTYRQLLTTLVEDYRKKMGQDLPFFIVQLPSIGKVKPYYFDSLVARLREAQASIQNVKACFCLTSYDTVNSLEDTLNPCESKSISIHPLQKKALGQRLADAIYAQCYKNGALEIPRFAGPAVPLNGCIKINIMQTGGGLKAVGANNLVGFTIAGANQKFHLASARTVGDSLIVSSQDVPRPVAVRYLWADNTVGNLFAKNNWPVQPFRTDNWPLKQPYAGILDIVVPH